MDTVLMRMYASPVRYYLMMVDNDLHYGSVFNICDYPK